MQCRYYEHKPRKGKFQYRKRYGLHAIAGKRQPCGRRLVSIPQAVWIACNMFVNCCVRAQLLFQYRKRYGLHAMTMRTSSRILRSYSFNTASGMDCMQFVYINLTPHDLAIVFQYRKRYGLHAISSVLEATILMQRFNTASGMDCMQFWRYGSVRSVQRFQYRKRYGLHAILSPRTLENSEPRNRFSSTEPSKRQVQRTQAIGQRLVCENVPRTRAKGEARLADVDRSALPFCTFPQT